MTEPKITFAVHASQAYRSLRPSLAKQLMEKLLAIAKNPGMRSHGKDVRRVLRERLPLGEVNRDLYVLRLDRDLRVMFAMPEAHNTILVMSIVGRGSIR
jgi:hypothetical protein